MQRPFAIAQTRRRFAPARIAALTGAGVIEALLLAAMLSGIGIKVMKQLPRSIAVNIIEPEPPKPEPVPVPQPQMVQPSEPTVAIPDIKIETPAPKAITAVAVPKPVVAPPAPPAPVVAPPAPPAPVPETPLQSITSTHTTPPYPELARRQGEHGTVQLHIAVDASGQVTSATVTRSSGHSELDEAAVEWVKSHWRYKAPTRNGQASSTETNAAVVFDLKNAG